MQIDVGNRGDGNAANDIVYLRTSDNRIWTWTQTAWRNTGGWLTSIAAGDGQVFGQAADGQLWRYRPGSGWMASGGGSGDDHLALANIGDKSAGTDLVFLLSATKSLDYWDQFAWKSGG